MGLRPPPRAAMCMACFRAVPTATATPRARAEQRGRQVANMYMCTRARACGLGGSGSPWWQRTDLPLPCTGS